MQRRADRPGNARAHGGKAAKKAAARGRGRKGSVCATHSVATHASIHRARQSRQVGQVGELRAPQAPRKVRPSILQPLAAGVLERLSAGRRRPTATAGAHVCRWRGSRRSPRLRRLRENKWRGLVHCHTRIILRTRGEAPASCGLA